MNIKTVKNRKKEGVFVKLIDGIEVIGNKLPHPFWLFMGMWIIVLVCTGIFGGTEVKKPNSTDVIVIKNLLSQKGLSWVLQNIPKNYMKFDALGLIIVMMIGLGIATESGLLENAMKKIAKIPERFLIFFIFLIGIMGNIASSAASVVIPPLCALIFFEKKKNPVFGLTLGFAAVSSGFTANIFIAGTDVLLSGISTNAYQIVSPKGVVEPTCNFYFMFTSVFAISILGSIFTKKFLMPHFGQWSDKFENCKMVEEVKAANENKINQNIVDKGLKNSLICTIVYWGIIAMMTIPSNGILRDPSSNSMVKSTLVRGIVAIILFYFISVGYVYGKTVGTIKSSKDIIKFMKKGVGGITELIVLILPIANFIETFKYSNLADVLAIKLADVLIDKHLSGGALILGIALISCLINLFITSGSTKWALLAPVFIPVMYYLGYSPALTQVVFRIGDSSTNTITPMYSFLPLHLAVIQKYDKDAGLGSIFSKTLPLSFMFFTIWIILLFIWYKFNIPLGPGSYIFVNK